MSITEKRRHSLVGLFKPDSMRDPYKLYRQLREEQPVYWDNAMQSWIVLRHADIVSLIKDPRLSEDRVTPFYRRLPLDKRRALRPLADLLSDMMLFNDPPRHTELRAQFRKSFTPRLIEGLADDIEHRTRTLLGDVRGRPVWDLLAEIAQPLSRGVIASMLGIPGPAERLLYGWNSLLHEFFMQSELEVERVLSLRAIFEAEIRRRRSCPARDLLANMEHALSVGDGLGEAEMFAAFILLIDAGQVTTSHFSANAVRALLLHPEQWVLLRAHPELASGAVLELLRWDSSVQFTSRIAVSDIEIAGEHIQTGASVTLILGSGNRDPDAFEDPDKLDITRDAVAQLSLGHGIHYCLGGALARLEIEILLRELVAQFPDLELADTDWEWEHSINFRFLRSLRVLPGAISSAVQPGGI